MTGAAEILLVVIGVLFTAWAMLHGIDQWQALRMLAGVLTVIFLVVRMASINDLRKRLSLATAMLAGRGQA